MNARILGRGAELQQVGALLADETPTVRALVLTGDAGVGKTTIWAEGVRLAGERGLCVLAARPAEAEAVLPFAALGDLLDPVVDAIGLPRPQRAALDRALQRADADEPADPVPVPESLGELLRLRLQALSAGAREATLLTAASTQPTWTLIERAAAGTDGLAQAVHADVLRLDGERVRFSHPLHA